MENEYENYMTSDEFEKDFYNCDEISIKSKYEKLYRSSLQQSLEQFYKDFVNKSEWVTNRQFFENLSEYKIPNFKDTFGFFFDFNNGEELRRQVLIKELCEFHSVDEIPSTNQFWDKQFGMIFEMIKSGKTDQEVYNRTIMICEITNVNKYYEA